jgi:1-acyl-sn-glycerol-3-phosphate acyltransferase
MIDVNMLKECQADYDDDVKRRTQYERDGEFNRVTDESSYDACDPVDETFNYLRRRYRDRIKHFFYLRALKKYCRKINHELTSLKVVGRMNLFGILGGCIVTCNHISKVDSFAVRATVGMDIKFVAADFNNWKGKIGNISRNTGYLPIPANLNLSVMRKFNHAMEYFLRKKWSILIYPEQSMWRDYKKPRPLKPGAFHYAAKYRRPVVPLFITIEDKPEHLDAEGRVNFGNYTIHILPPIYPRKDLDERANIEYMMHANFEAWRHCYERTYGIPLEYDTIVTENTDPLVKQYAKKPIINSTTKATTTKSTTKTTKVTK